MAASNDQPIVTWQENGAERSARWRSESGLPPPRRVVVADDRMKADVAYRLACEGTALLWRGDYENAKQLLNAIARRIDKPPRKPRPPAAPKEAFHLHRQAQAQRARTLSMLLLQFHEDHTLHLKRAPQAQEALSEVYGPVPERYVISLRELLGAIGAHEWRRKGMAVPAAGGRIHPHYGVFSPIRSEYVKLVAEAPLPPAQLAFDIGTGTGVLAAVLAKRGVARVIATELDPRAAACARENVERLGLADRVSVVEADLFPDGRAPLVLCNPPWVPARPSSRLESAVYDPESRMLRGFLAGLRDHLEPGGEAWLVLSDFAERLGLRSRDELMGWIADAGLTVIGRNDAKPVHPRSADASDPLHAARSSEVTSLWRLSAA
ncbi:MAG TPA: class I SAM-dependent methyltransferase [Burkholderiales bacterium]|nr:class I SAM-dependent methyltransferase [Burkholderiales bacterium]